MQARDPAEEIKRLQRCVNDLISVVALPAVWSGGEPSQIVHTLLDALLRMLQLDFVYVRLEETGGQAPIEMVRFAQSQKYIAQPHQIGEVLKQWLGAPSAMASSDAKPFGRPGYFDCAPGTRAAE